MSNLNSEQLTELTERFNNRLLEFGEKMFDEVTPGVVRLLYDEAERWQMEQDEEVLEDYANAREQAYELGYAAGVRDTNGWTIPAQSRAPETPDATAFQQKIERAVQHTKQQAKELEEAMDRSASTPNGNHPPDDDPATLAQAWPTLPNLNGGVDHFAEEGVTGDDDGPTMPEHLAVEGYDLECIANQWRWRREGGALAWGPWRDNPDQAIDDAQAEYEQDAGLGYAPPPKRDEKLTEPPRMVSRMPVMDTGMVHEPMPFVSMEEQLGADAYVMHDATNPAPTTVTPLVERPIGRARDVAADAIAKPRTLAEVDAELTDEQLCNEDVDRMEERKPGRPRKGEEKKGKQPTVEELVTFIQGWAMGGVMPTQARFDDARPRHWGRASDQCTRLGISWEDLSTRAGLKRRHPWGAAA